MANWSGASRGPVLGYKILIFILQHLGRIPVYCVLLFVAGYYFLFVPTTFRATYAYFRKIHKYPFLKSVWSVYRNYYSLAVSLVDKVAIYSLQKPGFSYSFFGEENLADFSNLKSSTGKVILSGHIGNWELGNAIAKKYPINIFMVYLDAENKEIKELLNKTMNRYEENKLVRIIHISEDKTHLFRMNEEMMRGNSICMHADRYMEGNKTRTVQFMGHPVELAIGPFQLAAVYSAPLIFTFCLKTGINNYELFARPSIVREEGETRDAFIDRSMKYYVEVMEELIRKYPYQWFNFYDYWKLC